MDKSNFITTKQQILDDPLLSINYRIDNIMQELTKLNLRISLLEHGIRPKKKRKSKEKSCKQ